MRRNPEEHRFRSVLCQRRFKDHGRDARVDWEKSRAGLYRSKMNASVSRDADEETYDCIWRWIQYDVPSSQLAI
ncbi:hypothetical protein E4T56_gene358 [Termitomyces sp. T112]|nr:hypothetical protein E4T56_gene358 [Termitomyces sp. T112]